VTTCHNIQASCWHGKWWDRRHPRLIRQTSGQHHWIILRPPTMIRWLCPLHWLPPPLTMWVCQTSP